MPNLVPNVSRADLVAALKSERLARVFEDLLLAINQTLPATSETVQANLDAHIADTADAHQASAVGFTPAGGLLSNTVQAVIEELKTYTDGVVSAAGAVIGPAAAVSNNIATFDGITGKLIKDGGKALPTGSLVGTTDTQTLSAKTLSSPVVTGKQYIQQGAQTTKAAAASLTIAELLTGIIEYTGAAAALTLPTGADIEAGVLAGLAVDRAFDFCVINTGTGTATITTAAGLTLTGTMTVAAGVSAQFRVRRTAANTFTVYRIA